MWDVEISSSDPFYPNNKFTWSQEFRSMLGFNDENDFPNILSSWIDRIHPEDKEKTLNAFAAHFNDYTGKTPYDVEYRLMLKNGNYRYFHIFGTTLRDRDGVPLRVAGAIMDIDDSKKAQNQLLIMSSIVHNSPHFASYKTLDGKCLYINPAASIMTGYTHDELMDDYHGNLFDDETEKFIKTKVPKDLGEMGISQYEIPINLKNGMNRLFSVTSFFIEENAYASIASDITDEKKLETERTEALKALKLSNYTMENILNGLDSMIYVTIPDTGEILFINETMKQHYGIGYNVIGQLCYKVLQDGMTERCNFCPCNRLDKEQNAIIIWEEHSTLTKRIYHNTDRYINWSDGQKVHIQYSVDITELKQAQESLKRREKMSGALNQAAIIFMAQHEESFNNIMTTGLKLIADELLLNRISVWRNFKMKDGLHATQIYRWDDESGGTTIPTEGLEDLVYAKIVPRWEEVLGRNEYINSPVRLLPEAAFLQSFGVISIFVVPLFLGNVFWGCVLLEDRKIERFFDDSSADIMRQAAYLCTNTIIMYEMIQDQRQEGKRLEDLVNKRTANLKMQNSLMGTVNTTAAVLLEPETSGSLDAINHSMEMVCQSVNVDRVYLWQNVLKDDGKLYFKQVCKWMRREFLMNEKLTEYIYDDTLPVWKKLFLEGKSVNGPFDTVPKGINGFLSNYCLKSILAVPLFLKGELWGFVSFDDCHSHRYFPEADEHILRSWGLLVVGAIQRSKIMHDLEYALEEAKKASAEAMRAYAQAEYASEAKSRFIANMNHEMRTPMNAIVGLTDLMLEEDDVPNKIKETLEKINTAGNTLMGLISDVLDISKVEAGRLELIPVQYEVASLLNDVITLNVIRAEDKPIRFRLEVNEDIPYILFGDDMRVKQILNNLLSNAFKYTKEGIVTLSVSCNKKDDNVWVSFDVSDTGVGIHDENMAKLFTDYNQVDTHANREVKGTGLGLSITKKFVEMMDGEITVESEYGKGSIFHVHIRQGLVVDKPIGKEIAENLCNFCYADKKNQANKKLLRPDLSYAKVLVVDDFPVNLDVAVGMLRKYKMQVDCVMSGPEAIDRINIGQPVYDAVFMDHMMPGMDGIEATVKIRSLGTEYAKNIPVIALTANAVAESEKMFLENGFDAFLPKPFNAMSLDSIVQRWVRDKGREQ
jgi:PAS domain S-box-containing protein